MKTTLKLKKLESIIGARKEEGIVDWKSEAIQNKVHEFRTYAERKYGMGSISNLSNFMIWAIIQAVDSESRDSFGVEDNEIVVSEYTLGNVSIRQGSNEYSVFVRFADDLVGIENMVMVMPLEQSIVWLTDEELKQAKEIFGYVSWDI